MSAMLVRRRLASLFYQRYAHAHVTVSFKTPSPPWTSAVLRRLSTTTTNVDATNVPNADYFKDLLYRSMPILSSTDTIAAEQIQQSRDLLNEWHSSLQSQTEMPTLQEQELICQLLHTWYTAAKTHGIDVEAKPFRDTLGLLTKSDLALGVMQRWNSALEGSVDQSPVLQDYVCLIKVFSQERMKATVTVSSAVAIFDIIQQLSDWGYNMTPTFAVYRYASEALVQAAKNRHTNENGDIVNDCWYVYNAALCDDNTNYRNYSEANPPTRESMQHRWFGINALLKATEHLPELDQDAKKLLCKKWIETLKCVDFSSVWGGWKLLSFSYNKLLELILTFTSQRGQYALESVVEINKMVDSYDSLLRSTHYNKLVQALTLDDSLKLRNDNGELSQTIALNNDQSQKEVQPQNRQFDANSSLLRTCLSSDDISNVSRISRSITESGKGVDIDTATVTFAYKILASSKPCYPTGAQLAFNIWRDVCSGKYPSVRLNSSHATDLMNILVESGHEDRDTYCYHIYQQLRQSRNPKLQLEDIHYKLVFEAHSNVNMKRSGERLLELYNAMKGQSGIKIGNQHRSLAILACATKRTQSGAEDALRILDEAEEAWKLGDKPPDCSCYSRTMYALNAGKVPNVIEKCRAILERNEIVYEKTNYDVNYMPNTNAYNEMLEAYAQNLHLDGIITKAMSLLDHVEAKAAQGRAEWPTVKVYSKLMYMIRRRRDPDCQKQGAIVLQRMTEAQKAGKPGCKFDIGMYTEMIQLVLAAKNAQRIDIARNILRQACAEYMAGDESCRPNSFFVAALLKVGMFVYSGDHATEVKRQDEAIEFAYYVLELLGQIGVIDVLNHFSYYNLFIIFSKKQNKAEREDTVQRLFEVCRDNGYVNDKILNVVKRAAPTFYESIEGDLKNFNQRRKWSYRAFETDKTYSK